MFLVAALAWAQPVPPPPAAAPAVEWIAPEGCPTEQSVHARIDALLAEGGSGRRDPVRLRLEVTRNGELFTLRASSTNSESEPGERIVSGQRCDDIAGAAVLIAAIAIDPELTPPDPDPEPDPDPDPDPQSDPEPKPKSELVPAEPAPSPSAAVEPTRTRQPSPTPDLASQTDREAIRVPLVPVATADVGVGFGRLASGAPMALGRIGGGFERGRFRLLARLTGAGPSFGDAENGPAGGRFGLGAAGVAGCVRSLGGAWQVVGCMATDVGFVGGRGQRTTARTRSAFSAWWGIEAELGLEYLLRPAWALALRADGGGVPATPNLVVDGQGRVCCVEWSAGLRLGVIGRFRGRG